MIPPAPLARLALRLPGKRVWLGRPVVSEGQTLDRTVQWLLALQRALDIPALEDRDVAVCRRNSAVTMRLFAPREPSVSSEPLSLPGGAGPRPAWRARRCRRCSTCTAAAGRSVTSTPTTASVGAWLVRPRAR